MCARLFLLLICGLGLATAVPAATGGNHQKGAGRAQGGEGQQKRAGSKTAVTTSTATGGGHHKGAGGHEEQCVDISRYSEVLYNSSVTKVCDYKIQKQCQTRQEQVCTNVPANTCYLVPAPDCTQSSLIQQARKDTLLSRQFTPKVCVQSGTQTINQPAQRPVCRNVTNSQCESKWVINDQGEKVWDGNENCQPVTTQQCDLESYVIPIQVPVYTCTNGAPIAYNAPQATSVSVTTQSTQCQAGTKVQCNDNSTQQCITVEMEECHEQVVNECPTQSFQVPYQTFDHRLKCLV